MVISGRKPIQDMLDKFWWFMNERHRIYVKYKVDNDPWPWTTDPILQNHKFTNIFRELDTGTIWLRKNWLEPYADHPKLYFHAALYRMFNLPETMEYIGYQDAWDPNKLADMIEERQFSGNRIYSGAYILRGQHSRDGVWSSKARFLLNVCIDPIWHATEPDWNNMSIEQAWDWFKQFRMYGDFISYEVVSDLRHTRYLSNASDIMTWANPGPGAMRGINWLYGVPVGRLTDDEAIQFDRKPGTGFRVNYFQRSTYITAMRWLLMQAPQHLESHIPINDVEMRTIEHSLCEFDKYMRVKTGKGFPRSRFRTPQSLVMYDTETN